MAARTLAMAVALDDEFPDDVCPGCGFDITGWLNHDWHLVGGPFTGRHYGAGRLCPWTTDMLFARTFRRNLIRTASTATEKL